MATKLTNKELHNVNGGCGRGHKCSSCGEDLGKHYWSCSQSCVNHPESLISYKFCDACAKDRKHSTNYTNWKEHFE